MSRLAAVALFGSVRLKRAQLRTQRTAQLNDQLLRKLKAVSEEGAAALNRWLATHDQTTTDALILEIAGLRLPPISRPPVRVYITLPASLVDRLDTLADEKEQTRASLIRQAIVLGLDELP